MRSAGAIGCRIEDADTLLSEGSWGENRGWQNPALAGGPFSGYCSECFGRPGPRPGRGQMHSYGGWAVVQGASLAALVALPTESSARAPALQRPVTGPVSKALFGPESRTVTEAWGQHKAPCVVHYSHGTGRVG